MAIPETIAGRISVPVLNSSLKRRIRDEKEDHFNKGASAIYGLALFSDRASATLGKCLITSLNL